MTEHSADYDAPAAHRALLILLLENVHVGVSNEDIVVDTQRFDAPTDLRAALVDLMDECVTPPGATDRGAR